MFKGRVERVSHEGGLLVSYSGACPALESVMVDSNHNYIGKVDGVIGNLDNSLVHLAHLDRKNDPNSLVGIEITIRPRKPKQERSERRERPERRDDGRRDRNDRGRGRDRDDNRRDNRRDDRRGRDRGRSQNNDRHGDNDWVCPKCNNSNFAFRQECNRCGEPRGSSRGGGNDRRQRDGRRGRDNRRDNRSNHQQHGDNDWDCPKCNNSNFSFRTECNRCGEPRGSSRGGGNDRRQRDDRRGRDNRRDDRRGRDNRGGRDDRRSERRPRDDRQWSGDDRRMGARNNTESKPQSELKPQFEERPRAEERPRDNRRNREERPRRDDRRSSNRVTANDKPQANDWNCPQCGKSNFAKRTECFACGRSKRIGGPKRKGHHFSRDPSPLRTHRYGRGRGGNR